MMIYTLADDGWCEIARLGVDAERHGGRSLSSLMSTAVGKVDIISTILC